MTIEERNEKWGGIKRSFIHPKAGGRYWSIEVHGARVTVQHGKLNGKLTEAIETFTGKNYGKSNAISPELDALNRAKVQIEKKHREGYQEHRWVKGQWECIEPETTNDTLDFDNLPPNLAFYKPDNTVSGALEKKMREGKVWYTVKKNGLAYIIAKGPTGKVQMYSRRMHKTHDKESYSWNERFPHLVADAALMMANNSIILGELITGEGNDIKMAQRLTKSMRDEAVQLQLEGAGVPNMAKFYVWDIAFWEGKCLLQTTKTGDRFALLQERIRDENLRWFTKIEIYDPSDFKSPEAAIEHAKKRGWEGYVVVDPEATYGDKGYNFKGKPDRPRSACGKLKPTFYDDFVVEFDPDNGVGEWSTKDKYASGDKRGIKNVILYQYDSKGKKHYISELGVGLTEEMKRDLADPKLFPQVWIVSYKDRRYEAQGDDTNALDFSSYEDVRWTKKDGGDKEPSECINENL